MPFMHAVLRLIPVYIYATREICTDWFRMDKLGQDSLILLRSSISVPSEMPTGSEVENPSSASL